MQVPVNVVFRNMDRSDFIERDVREHVEKLEQFFDRMTSCHVVVEAPHQHHRQGKHYHVRIHLSVPHKELVVDRERHQNAAHEDVYVAIRDSFDAMRRQLEDYVREMRGDTKHHEAPEIAKITQWLPEDGFGFLETADGREIYFHRNAVLVESLADVEIGAKVRFVESMGEKGPQASTVRVIGRQTSEVAPSD